MSKQLSQGFETIYTSKDHVSCDGGNGPLGHPRVWLSLANPEHRAVCNYCSRTFVQSNAHDDSGYDRVNAHTAAGTSSAA